MTGQRRKMNNPFRFLKALSLIINPKTWGTFTNVAETSFFDFPVSLSWSQGGEDLALLFSLGADAGHYIDIGSHHPSRFSVTRHLYQRGWTGVNIDANPALIPEFNRKRKKDTNIWSAVGFESNYQLSIFEESAISTVSDIWNKKFTQEGQKIVRVTEVPGITLREIIDTYFSDKKVTLLSIDIEGADFEALKSIDFKTLSKNHFPDWILLETKPPIEEALKTDCVAYAIDNNYIPFMVLPTSTLLKNAN
jgi:FkbM family methyltransferase